MTKQLFFFSQLKQKAPNQQSSNLSKGNSAEIRERISAELLVGIRFTGSYSKTSRYRLAPGKTLGIVWENVLEMIILSKFQRNTIDPFYIKQRPRKGAKDYNVPWHPADRISNCFINKLMTN